MIARDRILFEDAHYLAVAKRAGELSVAGKGRREKLSLYDFLRKEYPGIRPVNRLDFETSGILLFARTGDALTRIQPFEVLKGPQALNGNPETRNQMGKTYLALVAGKLKEQQRTIRIPLPARMGKGMVPAETRFRVLEQFPQCALVEAEILTGRHHQIRKHFAATGHPLVLDDLYGDRKRNSSFKRAFGYSRFFLHAARLSFTHPFTGARVTVEAPLPKAFEEVLTKLQHQ